MSYKEVFDEFFKILGYEINLDTTLGTVMLEGASASNTLKLKRDESIILLILRLLYHEKDSYHFSIYANSRSNDLLRGFARGKELRQSHRRLHDEF